MFCSLSLELSEEKAALLKMRSGSFIHISVCFLPVAVVYKSPINTEK